HVIDLEAVASGRSADEVRRGFEGQVSMRTFVGADDIAATIAHLGSPSARFVSGQVIAVDGNTETMRS
ncbi:MAG: SDR family oxidoreductase, partial [Ilumatobacteraceae bacterium]